MAVVIREDLRVWQKLNVTAFTMGGIAGIPGMLGKPYEDKDGRTYLPMIRQPVLVFSAPQEKMRRTYERALTRGVSFSVYTEELFETSNDEDNRAAVRNVRGGDLNLVGLALYGDRKSVDQIVKGLKLHE
ncbi:MAG: DUF2000 domain-containing protein [Thermovirgaceae bacterium]|nr:DUF2000 domain-containing protein [Thermovirgaceae bacterium]